MPVFFLDSFFCASFPQTVFWKRLLVAELKHQSAAAAASAAPSADAAAAAAAKEKEDTAAFVWDDLNEVPVDAAEIEKMFSAAPPAKSAATPAAAPAGMSRDLALVVFVCVFRYCPLIF
jgi:hypothetical protein